MYVLIIKKNQILNLLKEGKGKQFMSKYFAGQAFVTLETE